jgi:hypothetical protein
MEVRLPDGTLIPNVPEGTTRAQLTAKLEASGYDMEKLNTPTAAPIDAPTEYRSYAEVPEEIEPEDLVSNQAWMQAAATNYQMWEQKPFEGTPDELSDWSRSYMANFNYDIVTTGRIAHALKDADQDTKESFLYMMDTFDNTNMSWQGTGNAAWALATDPTTLAGIGTLGLGTIAKQSGGKAAKLALKMQLKKSLGRTGVIAGLEGGIYAGGDNLIRQDIEVDASRKEEVDGIELAKSTGLGVVAGATLGVGLDVLATKIGSKFSKGELPDSVDADVDPKVADDVADIVDNQTTPEATPEATPKVEAEVTPVEPVVTPTAVIPEVEVSTTLPKDLSGAQPRWKTSSIEFESDIDKALFITSQAKKSKADDRYRNWLKSHGYSDKEIATLGAKVRARLKAAVPDGEDVLKLEATTALKKKPKAKPTPPAPEEAVATPKVTSEVETVNGIRIPAVGHMAATTNLEAFNDLAGDLAKQLSDLPADDGKAVIERLELGSYTRDQFSQLAVSVQRAAGVLADELETLGKNLATDSNPTALARYRELDDRLAQLAKADSAIKYYAGFDLRMRQENIILKDVNTLEALRDEGIPEEMLIQTQGQRLQEARETREFKALEAAYDKRVSEKLAVGDTAGALEEIAKKKTELETLDGLGNEEASFWHKLSEVSIGNVFSVTTIQVNLVASALKGLALPAIRGLMDNPLEAATRAEVSASYGAMRSSMGMAWRASLAGWRYEQALLTRDPERFLESGLSVKGQKGAYLRVFIRATNTTDEFLSQINYNSFIAGKAAHTAAVKAEGLGLKGAKRKAYLEEAVQDALKVAYIQSDPDQLITPLVNKGKNLGYTGEKLADYVKAEIGRDPEALRAGANEEALDYVRDVLYKKRFSGEGLASGAATSYENIMNKTPMLKWLSGQLFFRTPIRVFEEGIRMTPVAQYLAPNFIADLRGKNGFERQLRAKSESLAAFTMVSAVAVLYGEGRITGSGHNEDWRQKALQRDSAEKDNYTIEMEDGSSWSYRFSDPIATPFKIIVSTLEHLERLKIREAQGEFIGASETEKLGAVISAAALGLAKSIKDANLATGASNLFDAAESGVNPEDRTGFWLRFTGDKMRTLVPNTLRKVDRIHNPEMKAPADILQMLQTQILDPLQIKDVFLTSKAYDHMGRVKTVTDNGAFHNIYSTASVTEREKGRSETELYVDKELIRLQEVTGNIIRVPYNHSRTGDMDFRTVATGKGDETLFDKWNRYYSSAIKMEVLAGMLRSELPDGTFKHKAARVDLIQGHLEEARNIAFSKMMVEEQPVLDKINESRFRKTMSGAGRYDANRKINAPAAPWDK